MERETVCVNQRPTGAEPSRATDVRGMFSQWGCLASKLSAKANAGGRIGYGRRNLSRTENEDMQPEKLTLKGIMH